MTDDEIRLFNELMSTQPGEQIEGLASRYPDACLRNPASTRCLIR
jgi:hypothetical protein